LPSKEQLIAQIAGALNALAAKIAVGINRVPASLGRSLKAVSEKEQSSAEERRCLKKSLPTRAG